MKKKLFVGIAAGVIAAAMCASFAACGGSVSLPKGDEVNKETWEKAFTEKMAEVTNYTLNGVGDAQVSLKGTVKKDEKTSADISFSSKIASSLTNLYNKEANKYYLESKSSNDFKLTYDGEKATGTAKYTSKEYMEKGSEENEYWQASYYKKESNTKSPEEKENSVRESYWQGDRYTSSEYSNPMSYGNYYSYLSRTFSAQYYDKADIENAEGGYIYNLFDKFTYSSGVYTATLYRSYEIDADEIEFDVVVECEISISIKDGYIVGASEKVNASGNYEGKEDGITVEYTIKGETSYAVTDLKATDPSSKATKDITEAIEKATEEYRKQQAANNN